MKLYFIFTVFLFCLEEICLIQHNTNMTLPDVVNLLAVETGCSDVVSSNLDQGNMYNIM
jgi:hypothetical protein